MSCINFNNKPTHLQLKTRPSISHSGHAKPSHFTYYTKQHFCFASPGHRQVPYCPQEQQERGTGWLGDNKRQADLHRIHRTAACTDICTTPEACCLQHSNDNPAENHAGRQTGSDQWPRGQHEPCHRYLASSASGRAPGCPRRDQRPDRRLGGSSHQSRTWCSLGVRARTSASLA